MKSSLLLILVTCSLITRAQLTPLLLNTDRGVIGFYEFKPPGYKSDSTYNYPLMIFLHGVGERGNGTTDLNLVLNSSFPKVLVKGATMKFVVNGRQHAFLLLIPQMSKEFINWQDFYVNAMIDYAKKNLKVDTNKIFLTGWSLGGGGAWKYATASVENASKLAGIILAAPAPDYTNLCNIARGKVAVWAHHARDDASVPLHYTEDAITGINACLPSIPALITYYPSGGHPFVADWTYDTLNTIEYPNVFQWMIGTTRANSPAINQPPVCSAGNDTVVVLPSTTAILNGTASYDPNDVIVHYSWSVVSGPASPQLKIIKPDFPQTEVSGLEPGDYVFSLLVTDQFGAMKADSVSIKIILPSKGINAAPVAYAGDDVTTTEPYYYVTGSARDYDGTIKDFQWRQISGPVELTMEGIGKNASLWGLTHEGIYGMELSAFDDHSPTGIGKDTMFITRIPPFPFYFNYISTKNPAKIKPFVIYYTFISIVSIFCLSTLILYHGFTIKRTC